MVPTNNNKNSLDYTYDGSLSTHHISSSHYSQSRGETGPIPPPPPYSTPLPSPSYLSSLPPPELISPSQFSTSTLLPTQSHSETIPPLQSTSGPLSAQTSFFSFPNPQDHCTPLPTPNSFTSSWIKTGSLEDITKTTTTKTTISAYKTLDKKPRPTIRVFQGRSWFRIISAGPWGYKMLLGSFLSKFLAYLILKKNTSLAYYIFGLV